MSLTVPVIIPSYEPDERLYELARVIKNYPYGHVIIVNDGSGSSFDPIFSEVMDELGENGIFLQHEVNKGKGAALKTAFNYVLEHDMDAIGVTTADSDGQHSVRDIQRISEELISHPNDLVLGARDFNGEDIPWKSRLGNKLTSIIMTFLEGIKINDTQTGLRGIPRYFMKRLTDIKENRFEFETKMLLEADNKLIREVEIETIYDSKENHVTHFNPFTDSIKIYKLLMGKFVSYVLSSLSASVVDVALFAVFSALLIQGMPAVYIAAATILARICSATYNYIVNRLLVFKSEKKTSGTLTKYAALALVQMNLSAILTTLGASLFLIIPAVLVKMGVDTILFFMSYRIQQRFIF